MITLSDCPLCGSKVKFMNADEKKNWSWKIGFDPKAIHVICTKESCMLGLCGKLWEVNFKSEQAAAKEWNKRPGLKCVRAARTLANMIRTALGGGA